MTICGIFNLKNTFNREFFAIFVRYFKEKSYTLDLCYRIIVFLLSLYLK